MKTILPFCIYAFLGLLLSSASLAATITKSPAPDFTLKSNGGNNLRLSEHRGQVVLINFWASWCGPCRQEMPVLDEIQKKYQKLGFTILGVNVDKDIAAANRILNDIPVSFPILYDTGNAVSELMNVDAMPTTVLIDRNGDIRFTHRGYKPGYEKLYIQQIKTLIRE